MKRLGVLIASAMLASGLITACHTSASCASTMGAETFWAAQAQVADLEARGGSSGGFSGSSGTHSSSSGSSTGRSGGATSNAPSNSGTHTGSAPSNSGTHAPSAAVSSPSRSYSPPARTVYVYHGVSWPTSYGHTYVYTSPNGVVSRYVIHSHGYYHLGGYHDPYDPYDWTNYSNPASPYYGVHLHCG